MGEHQNEFSVCRLIRHDDDPIRLVSQSFRFFFQRVTHSLKPPLAAQVLSTYRPTSQLLQCKLWQWVYALGVLYVVVGSGSVLSHHGGSHGGSRTRSPHITWPGRQVSIPPPNAASVSGAFRAWIVSLQPNLLFGRWGWRYLNSTSSFCIVVYKNSKLIDTGFWEHNVV
jgi:hypothetical protein